MNNLSLSKKQIVLLIMPPILLATTYGVFYNLSRWMGPICGYLGGFIFYWVVWCIILPLWAVGKNGFLQMFKTSQMRFGEPAWLGALFLVGPVIAPFFTMFLASLDELSIPVLLFSALFAITNGTLEEVLWRGTYTALFPKGWAWSYWYPSFWFGYWHFSPQVVFPSQMPGGAFAFATMAIFLGLTFGWVTKKSGSIRYPVLAHVLVDFFGLAGLAFIT
jgi:membrane protease YdiL (CAAX protease family)